MHGYAYARRHDHTERCRPHDSLAQKRQGTVAATCMVKTLSVRNNDPWLVVGSAMMHWRECAVGGLFSARVDYFNSFLPDQSSRSEESGRSLGVSPCHVRVRSRGVA